MRRRTLLIQTLLYGLMFLWAGYTQEPATAAPLQQSSGPVLTIGMVTTAPGSTVTVPISFQSNGANIGALGFSISFNEGCLTYNTSALQVPATHSASFLNAVDTNANGVIDTLNVLIFAFSPTPVALPATINPLVTLTVTAKAACTGVSTPIVFSGSTSFNDANTTLPVAGNTVNGGVTIGNPATATPTVTSTVMPTVTPIPSNTPTATATPPSPTAPPTATSLPTNTTTPPPTITPTATVPPTPTSTPTVTGTPDNALLWLVSAGKDGKVDSLTFQDEDILAYNAATGRWALLFDGTDVGLSKVDVEAFDLLPDGTLLLVFSKSLSIPELGTVTPSDILRFIPTTLGQTTTGRWEWYFDGSDVDLTTSGEYIDALALDAAGRLAISTAGTFKLGKTTVGDDKDLYVFNQTTLGENTAGTWSLLFDGSRVALTKGDEDVDAAWIDPQTGAFYLSTKGKFAAAGTGSALSGDKNDLFRCTPLALGAATDCNFALVFDGDAARFAYDIDDVALVAANRLLPFGQVTTADTGVAETAVTQYEVVAPTVDEEAAVDPELTELDQDEENSFGQRVLLPLIMK